MKKNIKEQIDKIPKLAQRKAKKLCDGLRDNGLEWNEHGILISKPNELETLSELLRHVIYAVRGKKRPTNWNKFTVFVSSLKIPKDLLCATAMQEVKKAKKNVK